MFFSSQSNLYLSDPDVQLMLAFKQGDKAAFEKLMVKYFPRLLNFIYRFIKNRELAEDLTQEVFIKVYHNASAYHPKAKFKTWLYTIARNISLNEIRKNRQKMVSLDETMSSSQGPMQRQVADESVQRPDEEILHKEMAAAVQAAINDLPENQRTAVLLRRYEQFSYEEIAQTMKTSTKAVKSLLSRAKEKLKDSLKGV
ncbi:RNA polymerase sigma factor RpoE [hydrothermal vent metagenome]|uniref:RNA polymerase sigma factor RpoE n=1 Tax=hydrothermal vent metagenome TaxID=652676 RepID=A0A3B1E1K8_9ZZZZ